MKVYVACKDVVHNWEDLTELVWCSNVSIGIFRGVFSCFDKACEFISEDVNQLLKDHTKIACFWLDKKPEDFSWTANNYGTVCNKYEIVTISYWIFDDLEYNDETYYIYEIELE